MYVLATCTNLLANLGMYVCGLANQCGVQAMQACSVIVLNTTFSEGSKVGIVLCVHSEMNLPFL